MSIQWRYLYSKDFALPVEKVPDQKMKEEAMMKRGKETIVLVPFGKRGNVANYAHRWMFKTWKFQLSVNCTLIIQIIGGKISSFLEFNRHGEQFEAMNIKKERKFGREKSCIWNMLYIILWFRDFSDKFNDLK